MDYRILEDHSKERLMDLVNNSMKEGFAPCGGVSVNIDRYPGSGRMLLYSQAVVNFGNAGDTNDG